jgi:small subunit ribosomal protein S1
VDQLDDEAREEISIGKEITVYVVNPEDQTGNILLSYVRALEEKDWVYAESLLASGETLEGKIIGFNKGGVIIPVGQLRGFVPASQVSLLRRLDSSGSTPEQRWGSMIEEPITVSVIEVDRERRRLILSERVALQETRESLKERLLDELNEGDVRTGRVTSLADFGAFVNIDGADGLVHLSEISWERIEHPREVLKVGQEVEVKVIGIDRERKRIGLSIRQLQEDPWVKKIEHIKEGQLVEGTITHLTKFGAFARLDEDLEGLIHISEISEQRVTHPKEVLHEGDVVSLRVIKIEPERHRIGLSLRKVDSPAYTDFDWKMTLAEVVEDSGGDEETAVEGEAVVDEIPAETEGEPLEAEVVTEETAADSEEVPSEGEAVVEEITAEAEEEIASEAEAEVEETGAEDEAEVEEITAEVEEEIPSEAEAEVEETGEEDEEEAEEVNAEVEEDASSEAEAEAEVEETGAEDEEEAEEVTAIVEEEIPSEAEAVVEETGAEDEEEAEELAAEVEEEMPSEAEAEVEETSAEDEEEVEEVTAEVDEEIPLEAEAMVEEVPDEEELAEIEARAAEEMLLDASELGEVFEEFEPLEEAKSSAEGEVEQDESSDSDSEK